jgi:hypothetical protein
MHKYNAMPTDKQERNRAFGGRGCVATMVLAVAAGAPFAGRGQTASLAVTPAADAFVRALAPADNYGGAGALSVSGAAAVNAAAQTNGPCDTLIRFPTADLAASMNGAFGTNGWIVARVSLTLTEVAAPNNPIFNRGVGAFEVRCIAATNWTEGSGTPNLPAADGVAYQDLTLILSPGADVSLGQFTNTGASGPVSFRLPLAGALVSRTVAGAEVSLYLTAASPAVGFTFNSRNFTVPGAWPSLGVEAVAKPVARISSMVRAGTGQVRICFNTASNWTCVLQASPGQPDGPAGLWSNVFTVAAKPWDDQAEFVDGMTNRQTLYRLLLSR